MATENNSNKNTNKKIAIILIRGLVRVRGDIKVTLKLLRLNKKHVCAVREETPSLLGMLQKIKDYVTYGYVDEETINLLKEKRKEIAPLTFTLNPPKGGFERKGIKQPFTKGGALGKRDNIKDLIMKML